MSTTRNAFIEKENTVSLELKKMLDKHYIPSEQMQFSKFKSFHAHMHSQSPKII